MQITETERLIFRKLTPDDAEDLHRIYSNPETMKFMGDSSESVEIVRNSIQKHIEKYYNQLGFGLWATVLKENNRFIGRCGLLYQEIEGVKDLELAYLIDRDFWGKGLATEAAGEIMNLGFNRFGFTRIIAVIKPENAASIRVAEKCGLNYEREISDFKDFGKVSLYSRSLKEG
ncbi:MAG TPA: GNAT family N-acetyltransferase [Pyrinomonadaceae bacterium]|nr:GNAT family N-acetyltransferase [Pyrinomonadaceae bacterium]